MTRSVAIMQPYIFPYIGYMNLVKEADIFVFYDDVNFIKQGWINRNSILLDGKEYRFTIPLRGAGSNRKIMDIEIDDLAKFSNRFISQLKTSYRRSSFLERTLEYVDATLNSGNEKIGDLAAASVVNFFDHLGIERRFIKCSEHFGETIGLGREERLVEITKLLNCDRYINSIGGKELYSKEHFMKLGVDIKFVKPSLKQYKHLNVDSFIPGLSVIDLMMNLSREDIIAHVASYEVL